MARVTLGSSYSRLWIFAFVSILLQLSRSVNELLDIGLLVLLKADGDFDI